GYGRSRAGSSTIGLVCTVSTAEHHGDLALVVGRLAGRHAHHELLLRVEQARGPEHESVGRPLQFDAAGRSLVAQDVDHLAAGLGGDVVAAADDPAVPAGRAGAGLAIVAGADGDAGAAPDRLRARQLQRGGEVVAGAVDAVGVDQAG